MRNFGLRTNGSALGGGDTQIRPPIARYLTPRNSILIDDEAPDDIDDVASSALKFLGTLATLAVCLVVVISYLGIMAFPRFVELIK